MNMEEQPTKVDLKEYVLQKISEDSVRPRSKAVFMTRECAIWTLWVFSILIGAIAIAVILFVAGHQHYAIYEATHDNFLTFVIDFLPILWLLVFAGMAYVAVYNLRHTRHGYRYQTLHIISSSLFLSFFAGGLLQYFGFGFWVDNEMGKHISAYRSQEKMELQLWQVPSEGRLVGEVVDPSRPAEFADMQGNIWQIETAELLPHEAQLLVTSDLVRVVGTTSEDFFHVCGVFPMAVRPSKLAEAELQEIRANFREKIVTRYQETLRATGTVVASIPVCQSIPIAKRMRSSFVQETAVR